MGNIAVSGAAVVGSAALWSACRSFDAGSATVAGVLFACMTLTFFGVLYVELTEAL